jgi:hypothetical protein
MRSSTFLSILFILYVGELVGEFPENKQVMKVQVASEAFLICSKIVELNQEQEGFDL